MGDWAGSVVLVLALGATASTTWEGPGGSPLVDVLAVASGVPLVAGLAVALVMEVALEGALVALALLPVPLEAFKKLLSTRVF